MNVVIISELDITEWTGIVGVEHENHID